MLFDELERFAAMSKETVTFRIDAEKRAALDRPAGKRDRNRSYLLNEAVDAYLDAHAWQIAHIEESLCEAATGDFADEAEVTAVYDRFR
jgi:predicted transcriptional regulator